LEGVHVVRCGPHQLAAGPDGLCVLCRRAAQPVTPRSEPRAGQLVAKLLTWLLAVGMVTAGVFVYRLASATEGRPTGSPETPAASKARGIAPKPEAESASGQPTKSLAPLDPEHLLDTPAGKEAELPTADIRRRDEAAREQRESEARDQARRAGIQADMRARDLKAARRNVAIAMYSTTWCPSCTEARDYMRKQGIAFAEYDVDRDERARRRSHRLNPRRSVPTIEVDGDVMVGFSSDSLENSIERAAEKRASR
jgi:glutaredoxin 3